MKLIVEETELICCSIGSIDPILCKKKIMSQNFGQLTFFKFIIFCFSKKLQKQKKQIKLKKLI